MINVEWAKGNMCKFGQWKFAVANLIDSFKEPDRWLNSFLNRNGYSFRRNGGLTSLSLEELIK